MNWFYAKDGQQIGPVEFSEIERLQAEGQLTGDSLVWQRGSPNWVKLSTVLLPSAPVSSLDPIPPQIPVATPSGGNNSLAIASLVLGIFGLFCCIFLGIGAVVCGHIALNESKKHGRSNGLAVAGLILGYLGIAIQLIGMAINGWMIYNNGGSFDFKTFKTP